MYQPYYGKNKLSFKYYIKQNKKENHLIKHTLTSTSMSSQGLTCASESDTP